MIIVNSDELIVFLNQHLKHKLNGNPASLTKYVLALLKKKRGEKELREVLLDSLDVFLNKETPSFVDMLLSALKTKSYIREKENTEIDNKDKEMGAFQSKNESGSAKQEFTARIGEASARPPPSMEEKRFPSSQAIESFDKILPENQTQLRDNKKAPVKRVFERCKDYELRGFCLAGNLCQYDHGSDALVVDDVNVELFPSRGPEMIAPPLPTQALPPLPPPPPEPPVYPILEEAIPPYNPEEPGMCMEYKATPSYIDHDMKYIKPTRQRQLIGVPTVDNLVNREREKAVKRKGNFDFNRLGPASLKREKLEKDTSILQLQNVPNETNTIANLNSIFSEFGSIKNIEIGIDGDSDSAIIKFSNPSEALHAFRNVNNENFDVYYTTVHGKKKKEKLGNGVPPQTQPHNFPENSSVPDFTYAGKKSLPNRSVFIPKRSHMHKVFKKDFPKETKPAGGAMEKKLELLKKKQDFLATQIANFKLIADKMMTAKNKTERDFLKDSLQKVSAKIAALKNEIKDESVLLKQTLSGGCKKEKSAFSNTNEKAILDAELDFYNSNSLLRSKNPENPDSERKEAAKLLYEVNNLKEKAKWLGLFESPLDPKLDGSQVLEKQNSEDIDDDVDSSLQEELQDTEPSQDLSVNDAILLADDEEEDEDEDSEARSWRR